MFRCVCVLLDVSSKATPEVIVAGIVVVPIMMVVGGCWWFLQNEKLVRTGACLHLGRGE